jgi:hypothetical protein
VIVLKLLGVLSGLFSLALLVLPTMRVLQGRLEVRRSIGLWIAGVGFGWLAVAAFVEGEAAAQAVSLGFVATAVGSIVQNAATRGDARLEE